MMDMTTEAGALFGNDLRHKAKVPLLDFIVINPCVITNVEIAIWQTGKPSPMQLRARKQVSGLFLSYLPPPFAMSSCEEIARRRVNYGNRKS